MTSQEQLGFGDMLADAAETNAKRVFEKQTAHLPDKMDTAIVFHRDQIAAHHEAMLACDFDEALSIRKEAHLLARKLNDGKPGILAHDNAPGNVLGRACAAAPGDVPLWGQDGRFEIVVARASCDVCFNGMFSIAATILPFLGFEVRAVDKTQQFISSTGYRSFSGSSLSMNHGVTLDKFAAKVIAQYVETELKGKLVKIA